MATSAFSVAEHVQVSAYQNGTNTSMTTSSVTTDMDLDMTVDNGRDTEWFGDAGDRSVWVPRRQSIHRPGPVCRQWMYPATPSTNFSTNNVMLLPHEYALLNIQEAGLHDIIGWEIYGRSRWLLPPLQILLLYKLHTLKYTFLSYIRDQPTSYWLSHEWRNNRLKHSLPSTVRLATLIAAEY